MEKHKGLWIVEWTAVYTTTKGTREYTRFYLYECRGGKMYQTMAKDFARRYSYRVALKHLKRLSQVSMERAELLGLRDMQSLKITRVEMTVQEMGESVARTYTRLYGKEGK
jgi:hypothetical protein